MRVLMTTWGSRGDVQPYLALARGFRRAGHDVRLAAPAIPAFRDAAAEQGIPYVDVDVPLDSTEVARFLDSILGVRDPIRQARKIIETFVVPSIDGAYRATLEHARWADVVVSHFFQPVGRMVAEATGTPWVSGSLAPMQPTALYPPPNVPNLGPAANRLLWWAGATYINSQWSPALNRHRRRLGLAPFRDLFRRDFFSPSLDLVGVSPRVAPRPPDWLPQTRVTGYWFLERPEWTPPPELAAFLDGGPKPIAIGFGSMSTEDGAGLTRTLVEAVARSGDRAVLQAGWAELGRGDLPPTILRAADVPHDWLFPRVRAVVHHGGAGTSAAVFRAGVPSVFVPHIADQQLWAGIARARGVAPSAVPRAGLSASAGARPRAGVGAERLARAIVATRDSGMAARAGRLGESIRAEDGVGTAVRAVEALLAGHSAAPRPAANLAPVI